MKKIITTILILAMAVSNPVKVKALTLDEARSLAEANYPLIQDFDLISLTEQYNLENASKAWLPQIEVGLQATWQTAVASYPGVLTEMLKKQGVEMKGLDKFQYKAAIDVKQTIWDGGKIRASKEVMEAEAEEQRANNRTDLFKLRERVDQIYFGILLLEEQKRALGSATELLESNLTKVEALLRNGAAMQSDADAIQAELLTTNQQTVSVESQITAYRQILALYTGATASEVLEVPADIGIPLTSQDYAARPEYRLMDARINTIEAKKRQINMSVMPTIGAFAQGFFGYPGLDFMKAMIKRDPGFNAMIGVKASWEIGSLYTKQNKLKALDTQAERIRVAREVFDFNSDLQDSERRNELERLRKISQDDDKIIELRARVRRASEAQLREGVIDPTTLLQRITEEKNAKITANTHRIEYLKTLYQLRSLYNL